MHIRILILVVVGLFLQNLNTEVFSQSKQELSAFVEVEGAGHIGDNTPLWQVSNRNGLPSLNNYGYLRSGAEYKLKMPRHWSLSAMVDLVANIGLDRNFIIQQAYADLSYRWLSLSVGSKERAFEQLNSSLSSGGLVWSGNARPIPQIRAGAFEYVQFFRRFALKGEISYGWFTDNDYQYDRQLETDNVALRQNYWTSNIKYHNKNFYMRIGDPSKNWIWEMGYRLDTQFGGIQHVNYTNGESHDISLGSGWKQYWQALIPQRGDESQPEGSQIAYAGNMLGSELLKLIYQWSQKSVSVYMENYFDDFSAMGKLNGFDGLWGFEYKNKENDYLNNLVVEYYQSTNQSGPLHGVDYSELCQKTGGGDNYYNNFSYPGWTHWGRSIGTPLVASPMYNDNGILRFKYTRVRAVHIGVSGFIFPELNYRFKMSFNRTWGTVFEPIIEPLENFSAFLELTYMPVKKMKGWSFTGSLAGDAGGIYGDNLGVQFRIRRVFDILKK